MPGNKVEFCEGTKPPNHGAMKILTNKIKKDTIKIKPVKRNNDRTININQTKMEEIMQGHTYSYGYGNVKEPTKMDIKYDKDIRLLMSQTNVTREVAEKVFDECDEDIVNSIMYILGCH